MRYEAIFKMTDGGFICVEFSAERDRDALLEGLSPEMCARAQELACKKFGPGARMSIYYGSLCSISRVEEGKIELIYPGIYYIDGLRGEMANYWGNMEKY